MGIRLGRDAVSFATVGFADTVDYKMTARKILVLQNLVIDENVEILNFRLARSLPKMTFVANISDL